MGKKGAKNGKATASSPSEEPSARSNKTSKKSPRITLQDVLQDRDQEDGSTASSSSSELPPEEEWDAQALALKRSIESGAFDHLLDKAADDESSVEEVELDNDDDDDDEEQDNAEEMGSEQDVDEAADLRSDEESESEEGDDAEQSGERDHGVEQDEGEKFASSVDDQSGDSNAEDSGDEEEAGDDDDDDSDDESNYRQERLTKQNQINSKALHVVTEELQSRKRHWPWVETFDVQSAEPLPFTKHSDVVEVISIHDDLKREVAFYDVALAAVARAREQCAAAKIPFSRPDDYFAEMVKTDDHMAKVKDRLIFETKKMEAVAQRKSNKEHKLRAKEAHAHKLAEKAKRKREHFKSLDDWAQSAAEKRGRKLLDDDEDQAMLRSMGGGGAKTPNKKRLIADKKYGFGGKRGRFKQNDRKTLNDTSSFNPRGGFAAGTKRTAPKNKGGGGSSGGKKRPGKRARDAQRAK